MVENVLLRPILFHHVIAYKELSASELLGSAVGVGSEGRWKSCQNSFSSLFRSNFFYFLTFAFFKLEIKFNMAGKTFTNAECKRKIRPVL